MSDTRTETSWYGLQLKRPNWETWFDRDGGADSYEQASVMLAGLAITDKEFQYRIVKKTLTTEVVEAEVAK